MFSWLQFTLCVLYLRTCQNFFVDGEGILNLNITLATYEAAAEQSQKYVLGKLNTNESNEMENGVFERSFKFDSLPDSINFKSNKSFNGENIPCIQTCQLALSEESISKFRHLVYYFEVNFVYLYLTSNSSGVKIIGGKDIVGENIWVWTFAGKSGGLEFLKWPIEFGIWSLGLLTSEVELTPISMHLFNVSGDCTNIHVGNASDDLVISKALVNLSTEMMKFDKDKYGPSFWCYKQRMFIEPHFFYYLCKHIVCPVEAIMYSCCTYFFNTKTLERQVECGEKKYKYDSTWWVMPIILAVVLFSFCPLVIMNVAHTFLDKGEDFLQFQIVNGQENVSQEQYVFLGEHHYVTLFNTICYPFYICGHLVADRADQRVKLVLRMIPRLVVPLLSLSVIGLQIFLDYIYLHSFILTSLEKGVPLGFRSMIAGYEASKENFLPLIGGPFVAISIYLGIAYILIIIPDSLSEYLTCGLQHDRPQEPCSPLTISLRIIELYGSLAIRRQHGYLRLYNAFLAQFYMLINIKFWRNVLDIQIQRLRLTKCCRFCYVFLPLYFVFCFLEMLLCVFVYGFPIVAFGLTIIRAYLRKIYRADKKSNAIVLYSVFLTIILSSAVCMFLFMFCSIFLDATLLFVRITMYTYTGVVIFPKIAYGYIIFACTVAYYLWECIKEFSLTYDRLLRDTISVCESLQRANDVDRLVVKMCDVKGVKITLFEHVIESFCPRRKHVLVSLLKVSVILGILGVSINLLFKVNGFRELHVIMHVGIALFVCALPKIMKTMYRETSKKLKQRRYKRDLKDNVKRYLGYLIQSQGDISDYE